MQKFPRVNNYSILGRRHNHNNDWNNSILFLGCSMVYGQGVNETETVVHQLELQTSIPCINLGVCGASPMFTWSELSDLLDLGIRPKGIVVIWSDPSRFTEYNSKENMQHFCAGDLNRPIIETSNLAKEWLTHEYQGVAFAERAMISCRAMCKDIPYFEYSWYQNKQLGLFNLGIYNCDVSTDNSHPGPLTYIRWAEHIANDIKVSKKL